MKIPVNTRTLILETLSQIGSAYGAAINAAIAHKTDGAVELSSGSFCPAMKALEEEDLIEVKRIWKRENIKPVKVYQLTEKGKEQVIKTRIQIALFFDLR